MTGFASGQISTEHGDLLWEMRTVNHRYLETQIKLPDGFRMLEPALREYAAQQLKRGKLDAALQFRPVNRAGEKLQINANLAGSIIEQAEKLAQSMANPANLNAVDVLRWPGVVTEQMFDNTVLFEPTTALFETTLAALAENRAREGARIQALLEERLAGIAKLSAGVRARMPEVLAGIRERLLERARGLEVKVEPDRLEQELVLLAQKMDIAEELDRLDSHVAETREAFGMDGAVGRRLDFLMQEFNREANTLGSKSADPGTTKAAVDLKVLIEQLREQVQNVE